MQLIQPEVKELQRKYKGDRVKQQAATQEYYRQRGINPAGGCLPIILQFGLLIPMYSVISQGLTNYDPSAMWHIFGINLFPGIVCPTAPEFNSAGHVINACLNPVDRGPVPVGPPRAGDHRLVHRRLRDRRPGDHLVAPPGRRVADDAAGRGPRRTTTPTSRSSGRWPTSCR